jgi:hypothetical protein
MEEHRRNVLGARTITIERVTLVSLYARLANTVTPQRPTTGSVHPVTRPVPHATALTRINVTLVIQATTIVHRHATHVTPSANCVLDQLLAIASNVSLSIKPQAISRLSVLPHA